MLGRGKGEAVLGNSDPETSRGAFHVAVRVRLVMVQRGLRQAAEMGALPRPQRE